MAIETRCPRCGSKEKDSLTPRTTFECGTSCYDDRPGTYIYGKACVSEDIEHKNIAIENPDNKPCAYKVIDEYSTDNELIKRTIEHVKD